MIVNVQRKKMCIRDRVWRKGPVKFTATPLLTAEQVKQMPREALYHTLVEALSFDEGESIRTSGWHYKGKELAKGLENALYQLSLIHI